jgi:hypothetical protein
MFRFWKWFRANGPRSRRLAKPPSFRPGIEALEGRLVPAGALLPTTLPVISVTGPVSQSPAVQYFQFALQETPNQRFVDHLYQDLYHNIPPIQTIITLGTQLDQGQITPLAVARQFTLSQSYGMTVVQDLFRSMLHRDYNPVTDWHSNLTGEVSLYLSYVSQESLNPVVPPIAGITRDELAVAIATTPEYYNTRGGGTDAGWLTALYTDALHRAPTQAELTAYHPSAGGNMVNAGPDYRTATNVFASTEHLQVVVNDIYQHFLHRQAEPAGSANWVGRLQTGVPVEEVIAEIASSAEYISLAQNATSIVAVSPPTSFGMVQLTR